jgi:hypothetical protein
MHHLRYEEKWQQQVEYLVPHLIVSYSKFNLIIYIFLADTRTASDIAELVALQQVQFPTKKNP